MRKLVLVALAALLGCGDRLADRGYAGEPLAVLAGSMVPTPETEVEGRVRLAIAWYPQWMSAGEPGGEPAPFAIVTEDVEAEGTFPVDFRFPVYGPPPREALAPLGDGLAGKGAFGILLAYHDGDGDRRLDAIPADGAPVDRVIAASILGDARSAFAFVYVDSPQPPATGLAPGFNLIQGVNGESAEVVPLDTRMKLSLTAGGAIYDALVCEAGWLTFLLADVCGLGGGGGDPAVGYDGTVRLDGARLEVSLRVTGPDGPDPAANVNVNGRTIPWDARREAFALEEEASTLVAPGEDFIVSVQAAGESVGRVFTMPGDFAIEAPAEGAVVSLSAPLVLRWSASEGATTSYGGWEGLFGGGSTISLDGERSLAFDTTGAQVGAGSAFLESRIDGEDGAAFVTTALVRRRSFWFAP